MGVCGGVGVACSPLSCRGSRGAAPSQLFELEGHASRFHLGGSPTSVGVTLRGEGSPASSRLLRRQLWDGSSGRKRVETLQDP